MFQKLLGFSQHNHEFVDGARPLQNALLTTFRRRPESRNA